MPKILKITILVVIVLTVLGSYVLSLYGLSHKPGRGVMFITYSTIVNVCNVIIALLITIGFYEFVKKIS